MWEIKWDFALWEFAPLPGETQARGLRGRGLWGTVLSRMSVRGCDASPPLRGGVPTPTGRVPLMSDCS